MVNESKSKPSVVTSIVLFGARMSILVITKDFLCLLNGHIGPLLIMFTAESRMVIVV